MIVTLEEVKEYLRVDYEDEDVLIGSFLETAHRICMDVGRITEESELGEGAVQVKIAVMYAVAYLYEHREKADHNDLMLTLRALLSGIRREGF